MPASRRLAFVLPLAAVLTACQSIGPTTVARDRAGYNASIADSWKEQTLLNIVKLRYFDTPAFLDVSSVIASYQLQGEVSFAREIFPSAAADTNRAYGVSGVYTDRPTISYAPLTGEKFVNSLLRPIPPQAVFGMILSGHQADFILRATVRAINDVHNQSTAPSRARGEDPSFSRVVEAIRRLQHAGAIGMRVERPRGGDRDGVRIEITQRGSRGERAGREVTWLFFREGHSEAVDADVRFLRRALGIPAEVRELRLSYGSLRRDPGELAVFTRSIMEILVELAAGVDVPEHHLAEGRARRMGPAGAAGVPAAYPVARVNASRERPADAFVAIRYRDYWFWIDDRDLASKRVFTFLRMFSSIAETGVTPQLPVLTVPAN